MKTSPTSSLMRYLMVHRAIGIFSVLLFQSVGLLAQNSIVGQHNPNPKPVVSPVLANARQLLEKGKAAEAEAALDKFTRTQLESPEIVAAKVLLCRALLAQNKKDAALAGYEAIVVRHPSAPEIPSVLEGLIKIYTTNRSSAAATQARNKLITLYPSHPVTLRITLPMAEAAFRDGNYPEVLRLLELQEKNLTPDATKMLVVARALQKNGGSHAGLLKEASEFMASNQTPTARGLLEQYLKAPGENRQIAEARVRLGWCRYLEANKESYSAAELLWQSVSKDGSAPERWKAEADWHLVQLAAGPRDDWKTAVRLCDEIAKKRPQGSFAQEQALFSKAWLLTMKKQWKPALEAFENLMAAFPEKDAHLPVKRYREMAEAGLAGKGRK